MLEDAVQNLWSCRGAVCLAWHGTLGAGALLLGLWFAYEIWCRPYVDEAKIYGQVLKDRREREQEEREREIEARRAAGSREAQAGGGGGKDPLLAAVLRAQKRRQLGEEEEESSQHWGWKAVEVAGPAPGSLASAMERARRGSDAAGEQKEKETGSVELERRRVLRKAKEELNAAKERGPGREEVVVAGAADRDRKEKSGLSEGDIEESGEPAQPGKGEVAKGGESRQEFPVVRRKLRTKNT